LWIWKEVRGAERWMEEAAGRYGGTPQLRPLLGQAARELLLMESSDWEFLITTFQARDYAVSRFRDHLERFNALKAACGGAGTADPSRLQQQDNIFPQLDPNIYRAAP
jgi:1,4-alpha-glucan branching enzyme